MLYTTSMSGSIDALRELLERRIVLLDGSMGVTVQGLRLEEEDYRGERFRDHARSLRGCVDLLALTRPDAITEIHAEFLRAGADIVETNSFTATSIALADYGLEREVR